MTITSRIIAAAVFASALAFAPAAFADSSCGPQSTNGEAHRRAQPDGPCGCHRVQRSKGADRGSKPDQAPKAQAQRSNDYTTQFTDAG